MPPRKTKPAPSGLHAIVGTDTHLAEQALERILTEVVGEQRTDAVETLRGEESSWARLADLARSGSLFAAERAIVVRNADALKGEGAEILAYAEAPAPEVTVILLAARPDKRKAVWKSVLERAVTHAADPLKGRQLRSYVHEELRRRRLRLDEQGVDELVDRVGQDLRRLMGEIDKLEAFAGGRPLSADEVASVLGRGFARPLYRLSDAVAARQAAHALELVEEVLEEGEAALKLVGVLHRTVRQLRGARALLAARVAPDEIATRLDIRPAFKIRDVLEAARGWTDPDFEKALAALDEADRRLKSGGEPRATLTGAVVAACGGRLKGPRSGSRAR